MAVKAKVSVALQLLIDEEIIEEMGFSQLESTLAGRDCIKKTQAIANAAEALDIGDNATLGYGLFYHTGKDAGGTAQTDTISLRTGSGGADVVTLAPGQVALLPLAGTTPYAVASSTNLPVLRYLILED
jgi:ABC-type taurine transport system substrate-binding protein